ncbi:hypothetical protein [Salinispora tropica]|uniref:hypothetical protein n=1 Tax=Salinispora tropica TaxID=168695 RepID=UPI0005BC489F|nr:hypothetical protein [Salinispora tropica]
MSHGDPYYGNATEVEHTWARPPSPDCGACGCCTAPLCATATERGLPCWALVSAGPAVMNVSGCPCAPVAGKDRL